VLDQRRNIRCDSILVISAVRRVGIADTAKVWCDHRVSADE
jgi:hypothetical protein